MSTHTYDIDGNKLHEGARVLRVAGTSIDNLYGRVRLFRDTGSALVTLEGPAEPGIGSQFVAPGAHLRLMPESNSRDVAHDVVAALDMFTGLCGGDETTIDRAYVEPGTGDHVRIALSNGVTYELRVREVR
jgi:hypothetical protein